MLIGVPKEIKAQEFRVGITPAGVAEITQHDHKVVIESGAGKGCGFTDQQYLDAGAELADSAAEVFDRADLIDRKSVV